LTSQVSGVDRHRLPEPTDRAFMKDHMTRHLEDYRRIVRSSFQETAPRKAAKNAVEHWNDGVGSVVANHGDGAESSVVETTLYFDPHLQIV